MNIMKHIVVSKIVGLLTASLLLSGCVVQKPAQPGDDPYYKPVMQAGKQAGVASEGSLFQGDYSTNFFTDRRAMRVGDIVTVMLSEQTVSQKSSGVDISKENDLQVGEGGTLLGTTPSFKNMGLGTSLNSGNEFTGDASANQSNSLQGNITVTVADVLPNGNLVVRGEKWITLNRGDEFIRISGIIRPDDVSQDNRVSSMKMANARITYSGSGELADSQQMGWLSRFFNSPLWPL